MANPTTGFGLRPVRHIDGSPWNGQTIRAYLDVTLAGAFFIGDPVIWSALISTRDTTSKYMSLNIATGATAAIIRGVIVSFEPDPDNLTLTYRPTLTKRWANVVVATPNVVFQCRADASAINVPKYAGGNATLTMTAGSTVTGLSGVVFTGTTVTQAHPIHVLGISDIEGNEYGTSAIYDVLINTCYNTTGLILGVTGA